MLRALHRDPDQRHRSLVELSAALLPFAAEETQRHWAALPPAVRPDGAIGAPITGGAPGAPAGGVVLANATRVIPTPAVAFVPTTTLAASATAVSTDARQSPLAATAPRQRGNSEHDPGVKNPVP